MHSFSRGQATRLTTPILLPVSSLISVMKWWLQFTNHSGRVFMKLLV
eukprot:PDM68331.1 hypothetical protein PRIPAC_46375 [Pristionchus pacificus]